MYYEYFPDPQARIRELEKFISKLVIPGIETETSVATINIENCWVVKLQLLNFISLQKYYVSIRLVSKFIYCIFCLLLFFVNFSCLRGLFKRRRNKFLPPSGNITSHIIFKLIFFWTFCIIHLSLFSLLLLAHMSTTAFLFGRVR